MTKKICEKKCNGTLVEMVMDSVDFLITVRCMKQAGKKRDTDHDLDDILEIEPYLAKEILERDSAFSPMSGFLQSFVEQVWEEAQDLDSWYKVEQELIEEEVQ